MRRSRSSHSSRSRSRRLRPRTRHFGRPRRRSARELKQGPSVIRLRFDQQVTVLPNSIRVLNGVGKNFAGPARANGTDVIATVRT